MSASALDGLRKVLALAWCLLSGSGYMSLDTRLVLEMRENGPTPHRSPRFIVLTAVRNLDHC